MRSFIKKGLAILLGLILICIVIVIATKPNEKDFNEWLQKEYEIECAKEECREIEFTTLQGRKVKNLKLSASGISKGIFWSYYRKEYYNTYTDEMFKVEANGFLGKLWLIEEQKRFRSDTNSN